MLGLICTPFASGFEPNLGPDLESVTVSCDDVTVLFRQASQWTPGRFDYKGRPMTTEKSAYGTVFSFPEIGFIGTAHLENEPEKLLSLRFLINEIETPEPRRLINCETFRLERVSKIRNFLLTNIIEIRDNRIYETATVKAESDIPLKLVYHFMHAWKPSCSHFLYRSDSDPDAEMSIELLDDDSVAKKFYIERPVEWVALFEPQSSQFGVSRLLESPEEAKPFSRIWNVPGTYRKYYLQSFSNATVPAGFEGTWQMVTAFGESEFEQWENSARELAAALSPYD